VPALVIPVLELSQHLRELRHGEGGKIQIAAAILSRDASRDTVLGNLTHALQIAHFDFQIAEGLGVDLVDVLLAPLAFGQRKGNNVVRKPWRAQQYY